METDPVAELLRIEKAREARRKTRNRWVAAGAGLALALGVFYVWGSAEADRVNGEKADQIELSRLP